MDFTVKYDVAVVGAGVAGIAAALAAARRGHKVALIEKQTLIGGLATSGLIYIYLPLCDGKGTQVIKGISEEMLYRSLEFSQFDLPKEWGGAGISEVGQRFNRLRVDFSPAGFILSLDEMLAEAGVDLWLDTRVCAVQKSGDKVTALEVENTSGRILVQAGAFVDASGEAIIVRRAGGAVECDYNNLSLWLIENTPEAQDSTYYFGKTLRVKPFMFAKNDIAPGDGMDGRKVTDFTRVCYKHLREFYRESYKTSSRYEHYPIHLPAMPQFRKIAAAKCRFMLDTKGYGVHHEDSIGLTGDWRAPGPVWETPLRSLVPETLDGVFAAGRCMGAINDAWEVYRVIPTAAMTGEAAGLAAALTVENKCDSRDLDYKLVQDALRKKDVPLHLSDVNLTAYTAD
ncbi:MAG: FAD-dependent oxidoreductase [Lentisphaeria bacterium]|nr:FAD-dependent oxidoreductase [Lentisphaeria bacterium]